MLKFIIIIMKFRLFYSVSDNGMKVYDPMATILEGQVLDSQATLGPYGTSYIHSTVPTSPMLSPVKHRRLLNIRHNLGSSRMSVEGVKTSESFDSRSLIHHQHPNLAAPLHGVGIVKTTYLEDGVGINAMSIPNNERESGPKDIPLATLTDRSAVPSCVDTSSIFVMEMDPVQSELTEVGTPSKDHTTTSEVELTNLQPENPEIVVIPPKVDVEPGAGGDVSIGEFDNRGRHVSGSSKASSSGSQPSDSDQGGPSVPLLSSFNTDKDCQV